MSLRYSQNLRQEAERILEFHAADEAGWCTGCALVGITERAGECEASEWSHRVLGLVWAYGEPSRS